MEDDKSPDGISDDPTSNRATTRSRGRDGFLITTRLVSTDRKFDAASGHAGLLQIPSVEDSLAGTGEETIATSPTFMLHHDDLIYEILGIARDDHGNPINFRDHHQDSNDQPNEILADLQVDDESVRPF